MGALSEFWFDLQVVLAIDDVGKLLDTVATATRGWTWPAVQGFASPIPASPKLKKSPEQDLEALIAKVPSIAKDAGSVRIGFGELSRLNWALRPDKKSAYLSLALSPEAQLFSDPADCVRALTHVARRLLERGAVTSAAVERLGDAEACVPFTPLAKARRPLVVTTEQEVAAEYEQPDGFWTAGWTSERFGDQRLLTRCQNVVTKADVLAETRDYQWQMARAARPGRTKYADPAVTPEEKPIYEDGPIRVKPIGRHVDTGIVQYSCYLEHDEHVQGFEIYYLRSLVEHKQMPDGTPVSRVQVIFQKRAMAEREKRPLLDVGVEVYYRDLDQGEAVRIEA